MKKWQNSHTLPDIPALFSKKIIIAKFPFNFYTYIDVLHIYTHMSLTKYLSVADNARDAVLLHVSASTERQEWGNETGLMF
jgi:hypothetical protein